MNSTIITEYEVALLRVIMELYLSPINESLKVLKSEELKQLYLKLGGDIENN
jgi:hypothetical protein